MEAAADFSVSRKKLKVKIGEETFEVTKASLDELESLQDKLAALPEDNKKGALKIMTGFLSGLGIPEASLRALDVEAFEQLTEYLSGAKKK